MCRCQGAPGFAPNQVVPNQTEDDPMESPHVLPPHVLQHRLAQSHGVLRDLRREARDLRKEVVDLRKELQKTDGEKRHLRTYIGALKQRMADAGLPPITPLLRSNSTPVLSTHNPDLIHCVMDI